MKLSACTYCLLTVLLCGIACAHAVAADVSVTATVDKTEATLEDSILLSVTVEGTKEEPVLSGLDDFRVTSRGSSSQVRIMNGRMSSSCQFNYLLQPEKAGTFTIGPFTVAHKGKKYAGNTITLTISRQPAGNGSAGREVFVTAELDNERPYVNQRIVYALKFFRCVQVGNARLRKAPDFEGFMSESLGDEREYRTVINGRAYTVTELRWELFPLRSGVLTIDAAALDCEVVLRQRRGRGGFFDDPFFDDSFFGFGTRTEPKSLRSGPLTVMVRELPAAGRPPGFSQLVGDFEMSGSLSATSVHAGESATLTLVLRGRGNLQSLRTIDVSGLANVKVYDDKPVFESGRSGGTLTVKKALVPVEPGNLTIPAIEVAYFNPDTERYMTARAGPFAATVLPARQSEALQALVPGGAGAGKEDVQVLARDILPIRSGLDVTGSGGGQRLGVLHALLLAAPAVLYILLVGVYSARMRLHSDSARLRARSAWPKFKRRLPALRSALKDERGGFYGEAGRVLREFAGDRLGIPGSALTTDEIIFRLRDAGIQPQLLDRIRRVLDHCDAGCYGSASADAAAQQTVLQELVAAARELHRRLQR